MKILKKTLIIFMIFTFIPFCTYAEEEQKEIEGLHEALSSLFIENCFTTEEIDEMNQTYTEWYDNWLITDHMQGWKYLHPSATDEDVEEKYNELKDEAVLDFSKGFKVSTLLVDRIHYTVPYGLSGKMSYLFSDTDYWTVMGKTINARFTPNRELINHDYNTEYITNQITMRPREEVFDFLKDEDIIEEMLREQNIAAVYDMKIYSLGYIDALYIDTDLGEYAVSLYTEVTYQQNPSPFVQPFKLYKMEEFTDKRIEGYIFNNPNYKIKSKPTFETEAQALQAEGLLYGNENGLDLLKPLTRIEAAAMLLRALGESEAADNRLQVFSDVPDTHWGFGAASNAHTLGLIYGIGDNLFAPDRIVTAEEFSTMVLRASGESEFEWQNALNILIEKNIITKEDSLTMDFFTRGDMAKIIYEIKANGLF